MSRMSKYTKSVIVVTDKYIVFDYGHNFYSKYYPEFTALIDQYRNVPIAYSIYNRDSDKPVLHRDGSDNPLIIPDTKKYTRSIRRLNKDCQILNNLA